MKNALKNRSQLDELARRQALQMPLHMPMIKTLKEARDREFPYLPYIGMLVVETPIGHYKTKLVELGLDPQEVMGQVEKIMLAYGNSHACYQGNMHPIGSRMYSALKEVVSMLIDEPFFSSIFRETFPI